jgi:uncharacterized protein involved in exopolysaccharide biosynthesis
MKLPIRNLAHDDEFSLNQALAILWIGKWLVLAVTLVCTALALVASLVIPKKFEAVVLVSAASNASGTSQLSGLGSLASQFGGIASLAGLTVGGDAKKFESIAVLQSEALTEQYIQANNLLPILYARDWDQARMQWKNTDPEKTPTLWKANQYFKKRIRAVTTDAKTGTVSLAITWKDPVLAAKWANGLIKLTNDYLREKSIRESERNISYLNEESAKTNIVEVRHALFTIMQSEISKAMLARGSEEYAFKVLDPAVAPEKPKSPLPVMWTLIGALLGLFLGMFAVLAYSSWGAPTISTVRKEIVE